MSDLLMATLLELENLRTALPLNVTLQSNSAEDGDDPWETALATMDIKDQRLLRLSHDHESMNRNLSIIDMLLLELDAILNGDFGAKKYGGSRKYPSRQIRRLQQQISSFKDITEIVSDSRHQEVSPWACLHHLLWVSRKQSRLPENLWEAIGIIGDVIVQSQVLEFQMRSQESFRTRLGPHLIDLYRLVLKFSASYLRFTSGKLMYKSFLIGFREISFQDCLIEIDVARSKLDREAEHLDLESRLRVAPSSLELITSSFITALQEKVNENQRKEISRWLSNVPYGAYHQSIAQSAVKNTGEWFFKSPEFQNWYLSSDSAILWLRGKPGSGKIVLASMIIEDIRTRTVQQETSLAYFYCARAAPERSDSAEILRCIVRQLSFCDVGRPLRAATLEAYSRKRTEAEEQRVSLEKLNIDECVKVIVALLKDDPAFIILDGLDECERTHQEEILGALQFMIEESSITVKIVLSSRDESPIRKALVDFPGLHFSSMKIQPPSALTPADIKLYVESEVERAIQTKRLLGGRASRSLRNQLINTLVAESHGLYSVIYLQVQILCASRTEQDVEVALRRLPQDLHSLLDEIYKRIREQGQIIFRLAQKTIQWLLYSQRPLSSREMLSAVLSGSHESLNISPTQLVDLLANLIVLDQETDVFRFPHLTVREYLQRHAHFSPGKCHRTILQRCLQTFNLKCLGNFPEQPKSHQETENEKRSAPSAELDYSSSSEGLEIYASHHWLTHLKQIDRQDVNSETTLQEAEAESSYTTELETFLLHPSAPYLLWTYNAENISAEVDETLELSSTEVRLRIESTYCNPQGPQFVICAFGLLPILVSILGKENLKIRNLDWNLKNNKGLTPLAVALSNKDIKTGEILISLGAYIDVRDEEDTAQGTLLHTMVALSDMMAVDLLVKRGANLAERNADLQTPLNVAAEQGESQIIKVLLDADAEIDTRDIDGLTPLLSSVRRGHRTAAKLLIDNGAMIEARDNRLRRTSLHWAAARGETQILRLLLKKKCSLNARDYQGSTPLIVSLENEQNEVATLLLEAGADLKKSKVEEMTPLEAALQAEDTPCISDYIAAPELGPPGFISRGAQATTEILRNVRADSNTRDSVLLKKTFNLLDAESTIKKFLTRERYLLWKLRHPNIVEFRHYVVDPSETQGNLYMEFCRGGDLQRFVNPEDVQYVKSVEALHLTDCRLDWIDIWTIISDIAAALGYCHYGMMEEEEEEEERSISLMLKWQPVLHRDIKAANIVHSRHESGQIVAKLCDLGFARFFDRMQSVSSTSAIQPPELSNTRHWTTKGDRYCLGVTILALTENSSDPQPGPTAKE